MFKRKILLFLSILFVCMNAQSQFVYKIKADSVKITNDSCTAELILENSTKAVNGFLYNYGNGRTQFRKALQKLTDTSYVIGGDTLFFRDHGTGYILNRTSSAQAGAGFWVTANSRIDARLLVNAPTNIPAGYSMIVEGNSIMNGFNKMGKLQLVEPFYQELDYSDINYGPSLNAVATLNITNGLNGSASMILQGMGTLGGAVTHPFMFFGDGKKAYAAIQGYTRGGWGPGRPFGDLIFHTAPDSSVFAMLERMRLTSNGNLLIGTTTDAGYKLDIVGSDARINNVRVGRGSVGVDNTILGENALGSAGAGNNYNTAIGKFAMRDNTSGQSSVGVGYASLLKSTTGGANVAVGAYTMYEATTGYSNTAVGFNAARNTTTGVSNTALGTNALVANIGGNENTALGNNTLYKNTGGTYNVAVGSFSLYNSTTGSNNTAIGSGSLGSTTGAGNTALGIYALSSNATGSNNVALGNSSGITSSAGDNNIFIGYYTAPPISTTASNQLNIGNWIYGNNGKIGFGIQNPAAYFHLRAGAGSPGAAPLKFTAGTILSTPENGAMEFNGNNYFVSSNDIRYTMMKGLTATVTLNFANTAANSSSDINITVNGAESGDAVSIGAPPEAMNANSNFTAWVSAANTVTVRFNNYSTAAIDPASGSFKVAVIKY
jgi:hypothetical protein